MTILTTMMTFAMIYGTSSFYFNAATAFVVPFSTSSTPPYSNFEMISNSDKVLNYSTKTRPVIVPSATFQSKKSSHQRNFSQLQMAKRKKISDMTREELDEEKNQNDTLLLLKGVGFVVAIATYFFYQQ